MDESVVWRCRGPQEGCFGRRMKRARCHPLAFNHHLRSLLDTESSAFGALSTCNLQSHLLATSLVVLSYCFLAQNTWTLDLLLGFFVPLVALIPS